VTKKLFCLAALSVLAGCVSTHTQPDPAYAPARPIEVVPPAGVNGAIFHEAGAIRLFEDVKPRRVGDSLTIVLVESTNAKKEATTETKKDNTNDLQNPTLFGSPVRFQVPDNMARMMPLSNKGNYTLEMQTETHQDFSGSGASKQSNSLSGAVTVTVTEVLANGDLVVRGEKIVAINNGDEFVRLSGIVRPQDIRADNTVLSTRVANARISYGGSGAVADSNSHGWLSRFFLQIWPF
jgi:flagellar L-ring protein precursor FlgH